jgi:hypothetical protein
MPDDPSCQQQELDLRITFGQALQATKGYAFALVDETYARARLLAEQLDRSECFFQCSTDNLHSILLEVSRNWRCRLHNKWRRSGSSGEFVTSRVVRAAIRAAYAAVTAEDPHVSTLMWLALSLAYLGYINAARSRAGEALTEANQLGHVYSLTSASVWASWIECAVGSAYDIRPHAEQVVSLSSAWVSLLVSMGTDLPRLVDDIA